MRVEFPLGGYALLGTPASNSAPPLSEMIPQNSMAGLFTMRYESSQNESRARWQIYANAFDCFISAFI